MPANEGRWQLEGRRERVGRLLVDLAVVSCWVAAATVAFRTAGWPVTAYYAVVFGGVIGYSLLFDPWARATRDGKRD